MEGILITIGLIAIGLSGILVTLVQIIRVSLRKENITRKKQLLLFIVITIFGLVLFLNPFNGSESNFPNKYSENLSSNTNENEIKKYKTITKEKLKSIKLDHKLKNERAYKKIDKTSDIDVKVSKKALRATALAEIEGSFKDLCDVSYKDEGDIFFISLYPKDKLSEEISQLMTNSQNQDLRDEWEVIINGVISISEQYYQMLGEDFSISILNPLNEDNIIFTSFNGEEYYNVIDDLN